METEAEAQGLHLICLHCLNMAVSPRIDIFQTFYPSPLLFPLCCFLLP